MPRFIDPQELGRIWLDADAQRVPRPELIVRAIDGRQERALARLSDSFQQAQASGELTNAGFCDHIFESLDLLIVGWENMDGHDFSHDAMRLLLTDEALEYLTKARALNQLSSADLGKSESPPSSEQGGSVGAAATAARNGQHQSSPSASPAPRAKTVEARASAVEAPATSS